MSVTWIERKNGETTVTAVDYKSGKREVLATTKKTSIPKGVRSLSNGVVGGEKALRKAQAMDARLGVSDGVEYVPVADGAYAAQYRDVATFDKWMRAHKRVNHNAGCGTPAPGDFAGQCPGEFD